MKHLFFGIAVLFISSSGDANTLENSIWGRAAADAGINVATLYGIAAQESGMRWRDGTFRPWPWTLRVNVAKNGVKAGPRRYANKEAAVLALNEMIKNGVRNVDVGLMQVNFYWHGSKVSNPSQLLDPKTNIAVAASYLRDINQNTVSKTVGNYHSPSNNDRGKQYANHVQKYEKIINEKLK